MSDKKKGSRCDLDQISSYALYLREALEEPEDATETTKEEQN